MTVEAIARAGDVPQTDAVGPTAGGAARAIALWMLFLVGTINFVDRQLLSVLVEPIRAELHFTDTQFGLLTGFAFALFYAAMGLPVAMLADRGNRVRVVAVACLIWSAFTAACGGVSSFAQLALLRFGVGVGEAGGTAPSLSILADYYAPQRRAFVIGVFTANGPLGVFIGAALGGWAAAAIGWRGSFVAVGLVGVVVAPLVLVLVREPVRGATDGNDTAPAAALPARQAIAMFVARRSLRLVLVSSGLAAFVSYGMLNWIPAFLMRTQGMPLSALATWFAPAAGITFAIGILGGGTLVSWAARRSPRAYAVVPAIATALVVPSFAAALLVSSWQASLALMLLPMAACTIYVAPALALVQNLTPAHARATGSALLLLVFNIVGLGCGPLFVGIVSDHVGGVDSLRWGLLALMPFACTAAAAQWRMARHLDGDFAR